MHTKTIFAFLAVVAMAAANPKPQFLASPLAYTAAAHPLAYTAAAPYVAAPYAAAPYAAAPIAAPYAVAAPYSSAHVSSAQTYNSHVNGLSAPLVAAPSYLI